ncbi:MAG: Uma2 family endonuclease [Anaerolineae bacterium]|nr:Uma2 family endonuclease [Anaerolineae bacterium]
MNVFPVRTDAPLLNGPPQGQWTATDWDQLPDDGNRYEIIKGVLYLAYWSDELYMPSFYHQWINQNLIGYIGFPANQQGLAFAVTAPIGVFMPGCDPVQPDFVVVKKERAAIIHDRRIYGIPDLIVEILSPSNRAYDETTKMNAYAAAGLSEFGVVDPMSKQLRIFELDVPGQFREPRLFNESDTAHFKCLPTIEFTVGDLFAGTPDSTL